MTRVLLIVALLALVFWVLSVVDCAAQPAIRHRAVPKAVWILIVVLIPVLGGLLWFTIGRVRAAQLAVPDAPDDDPAFYGARHPLSAQDERIRQLEEELAKLDAEEDASHKRADDLPHIEAPTAQAPGTETSRAESPRAESPRKENPRPDVPHRGADGTSTPSPAAGEKPPRRDGDVEGYGRHGAIG